jgi:hypothetical protein
MNEHRDDQIIGLLLLSIMDDLEKQLREHLGGKLYHQLNEHLRIHLTDQLWNHLWNQLEESFSLGHTMQII